jgi:hypothetical protein
LLEQGYQVRESLGQALSMLGIAFERKVDCILSLTAKIRSRKGFGDAILVFAMSANEVETLTESARSGTTQRTDGSFVVDYLFSVPGAILYGYDKSISRTKGLSLHGELVVWDGAVDVFQGLIDGRSIERTPSDGFRGLLILPIQPRALIDHRQKGDCREKKYSAIVLQLKPPARLVIHAYRSRGLRLLMISSKSAAKSGSRTGTIPLSSSCALASAMHSEMGRPRSGSAGDTRQRAGRHAR